MIDPSMPADPGFISKLACQQHRADRDHDSQERQGRGGQPPAIPEQKANIADRHQARDQGDHDGARGLLEDQAQAHGPQRQIARGESTEESARQPEQTVPDGGYHRRHDLSLDAQEGQSLDDLKDARRDGKARQEKTEGQQPRHSRDWQVDLGDHLIDQDPRRHRYGKAEQAGKRGKQQHQPQLTPDRWQTELNEIEHLETLIGERPVKHPGDGRDAGDRAVQGGVPTVGDGVEDIVARREERAARHAGNQSHRPVCLVGKPGQERFATAPVPPILRQGNLANVKAGRPRDRLERGLFRSAVFLIALAGLANFDPQLAADGAAGREQGITGGWPGWSRALVRHRRKPCREPLDERPLARDGCL